MNLSIYRWAQQDRPMYSGLYIIKSLNLDKFLIAEIILKKMQLLLHLVMSMIKNYGI